MKLPNNTMLLQKNEHLVDIKVANDLSPDDVFNMLIHALGSFIHFQFKDDQEYRKIAVAKVMKILDDKAYDTIYAVDGNKTLN